jgi:hypothetical protein
MRSRQLAFSLDGEENGGPIPLVYLACRLTNLTAEQRQLLDSWCTHIEQAVTDAATDSDKPWNVSVHAPFAWSAPWNDRKPDADVYKLNSGTVNACAAVIVLCIDGGGLGVGQEFAWATALRLPILLLHPAAHPPSRQALGTPGDVTVVAFVNATELTEAVKSFLRKNRSVIEDWKRRSDSLDVVFLPLRELLAARWSQLGEGDQRRVEAESRIHLRRRAQLIDEDHAIAGASMSEILALVGAMDIDAVNVLANPTMPDLSHRQRDALALATDEYEWGGAEALTLETRARLELARGGTRRLSLATPADWVQFRDQTQGHG